MKINLHLFIFTLYLISGPVRCSDVTGYSGGGVFIFPGIKWNSNPYICKTTQNHCTYIKSNATKWFNAGRILLYSNAKENLVVFMRDLEPQDAGTYRFGVEGQPSKDVDLKVKNDACCGATQRVTGYLGENITIDCHYPEEFKNNSKGLYKVTYISFKEIVYTSSTEARKERFSLLDDREANVFRVKFSNLTEDDAGLHICYTAYSGNTGSYGFTVKTIQLQVTERTSSIIPCPSSPPPSSIIPCPSSPSSSSFISPDPTASITNTLPPPICPDQSPSFISHWPSFSAFAFMVSVCVNVLLLLVTVALTVMFCRLKLNMTRGKPIEKTDANDTKIITMNSLYRQLDY